MKGAGTGNQYACESLLIGRDGILLVVCFCWFNIPVVKFFSIEVRISIVRAGGSILTKRIISVRDSIGGAGDD